MPAPVIWRSLFTSDAVIAISAYGYVLCFCNFAGAKVRLFTSLSKDLSTLIPLNIGSKFVFTNSLNKII
jgi:hypothetical protein